MKLYSFAFGLLVVTGCVYNPRFVPTAVHYNTVVADTNNKLLLLNIARSSNGEPLYFTRISAMRSAITLAANGSVGTSLPESDVTVADTNAVSAVGAASSQIVETASRGVNTVSPMLGGSIQTAPSFDYEILDTQEFANGIQTEIPQSTVATYLELNWPDRLVASLLIQRVELLDEDGVLVSDRVENDPLSTGENLQWRNFMRCYPFLVKPQAQETTLFTGVTRESISGLANLDLFDNDDWSFEDTVKNNDIPFILSPRSDDNGDPVVDSDGRQVFEEQSPLNDDQLALTTDQAGILGFEKICSKEEEDEIFAADSDALRADMTLLPVEFRDVEQRPPEQYRITYRSVEAVFRYLGDCLRIQQSEGSFPCRYRASEFEGNDGMSVDQNFIFLAYKDNELNRSEFDVEIDYLGENHRVPRFVNLATNPIPFCESLISVEECRVRGSVNQSMQTLAFLNQLLNLQKSREDGPVTSTVRVVP